MIPLCTPEGMAKRRNVWLYHTIHLYQKKSSNGSSRVNAKYISVLKNIISNRFQCIFYAVAGVISGRHQHEQQREDEELE